MDLEAQGSNDNRRSCPKCFAINDPGAEFCVECGASLGDSADGSDSQVYQDLASANLLRMRGDFQGAVDTCLGILRRFPNNLTAHSLLGDIYYEKDELKQASEWYEMALDLDPSAERERNMLHKIKSRMERSDAAETARQIGINDTKPPRTGLYVGIVATSIAVVGIASYFIGTATAKNAKANPKQDISNPIVIPAEPKAEPTRQDTGVERPGMSLEDIKLMEDIRSTGRRGNVVLSAVNDNSSKTAVITGSAIDDEPLYETAVYMASDAFHARPEMQSVTVRILKARNLAFSAVVSRAAYEEAAAMYEKGETMEAIARVVFPNAWTNEPTNIVPRDDVSPTTPTPGDESGEAAGEGQPAHTDPPSTDTETSTGN
ncbi:MAG: hypothetical protein R2688_00930 [Fimbriimonadaceae bacterium]